MENCNETLLVVSQIESFCDPAGTLTATARQHDLRLVQQSNCSRRAGRSRLDRRAASVHTRDFQV